MHGFTVTKESQKYGRLSPIDRMIIKSERDLEQALIDSITIINASLGIVLWSEYGFRQKRLAKFSEALRNVMDEIGQDGSMSAIQLLAEETGLHTECGNGKQWENLIYLKAGPNDMRNMTKQKYIAMRKAQIDYAPAQALAMVQLALHRLYGWGAPVRLQKIAWQIDDVRQGKTKEELIELYHQTTGEEMEVFFV